MDPEKSRPWYRWHWPTWLVSGLAVCALIVRQCEQQVGLGFVNLGVFTGWSTFGWPFEHLYMVESCEAFAAPTFKYAWYPWQLVGNCLLSILLIGSTAIVVETWARSRRRAQFGLRRLLAATAVVSVLTALFCYERIVPYQDFPIEDASTTWSFIDATDMARPIRWPVLFALACTIYTLGGLAIWFFGRAYVGRKGELGVGSHGPTADNM